MIDDDDIKLSDTTLAALKEFLAEKEEKNRKNVEENWQLSQFWYDEKTAQILARECLRLTKGRKNAKIGCISCPTVFRTLNSLKSNENSLEIYLFEFDRRFQQDFGDFYVFYDFNRPTEFREDFSRFFDVLLVDPPFLSEECLTKVAESVTFLAKVDDFRLILCTGVVMETIAERLLNVKSCEFRPKHQRKLGNEFKCYVNYDDTQFLNSSNYE